MKSPDQGTPSRKMEGKNKEFERLVGHLVAQSSLFPDKKLTPSTKLGIIKAIENNEVTLYVSESANDRTLDAVNCLTAIYDELGKDSPDRDFLIQTVKQLQTYL